MSAITTAPPATIVAAAKQPSTRQQPGSVGAGPTQVWFRPACVRAWHVRLSTWWLAKPICSEFADTVLAYTDVQALKANAEDVMLHVAQLASRPAVSRYWYALTLLCGGIWRRRPRTARATAKPVGE